MHGALSLYQQSDHWQEDMAVVSGPIKRYQWHDNVQYEILVLGQYCKIVISGYECEYVLGMGGSFFYLVGLSKELVTAGNY